MFDSFERFLQSTCVFASVEQFGIFDSFEHNALCLLNLQCLQKSLGQCNIVYGEQTLPVAQAISDLYTESAWVP